MKLEKETALYDPNAIAKEVSNFTNEIVEINGGLQQLEQQIDGQVVTWFYNYAPTLNNLPASEWDSDEKELHLGDIFYNTTTYLAYIWSKSGSTYSWNRISNKDLTTALQTANEALDTADKKRRVFISTSSQQNPTPPYDYGDIWFQGEYYDKDILTCVYSDGRPEGASFVRNDWAKLNKYTDDSALTTFLNGTYSSDKTNLQSQIDKKAETWYQSGDPSTAWTTGALKAEHEGDLWYKTTDQKTYRYSKINNVYSWQQENVPTEVFDKIDGKAAVYTSQPSPPYNVGDLWFNSTSSDILTCMQSRTSGQYISSDWVKRNKYTDDSYAQTLASRIGDTPQYFWHNSQDSGAGEGVGAHITEVPKEDFIVDPANGGSNLLARSNGIAIRDGLTDLATFGSSGEAFWNEGGGKMFQVGRKEDGSFQIGESCFYDGSSPFSFKWHWKSEASTSFTPSLLYSFYKADGTKVSIASIESSGAVSVNGAVVTFSETVCSEMITKEVKTIKWSYIAGYDLPYFSLGIRDDINLGVPSDIPVGCFSVVAGTNNKAKGDCSYAGGQGTRSMGDCSHAEGMATLAQQKNSFAIGYHTHANDNNQFVTGRYNEVDTDCALIIGNGTESGGNSNALKIDWDGNMKASGLIYADGNSSAVGAQTNPVSETGLSISLSAGTWKTLTHDGSTTAIPIPKGVFTGFVDVQFSAATGSYRSIYFGTSSTGTTIGTQVGGSSTSAIINFRHPFTLIASSATNYYVRARSGVACNVTAWSVRLLRIR